MQTTNPPTHTEPAPTNDVHPLRGMDAILHALRVFVGTAGAVVDDPSPLRRPLLDLAEVVEQEFARACNGIVLSGDGGRPANERERLRLILTLLRSYQEDTQRSDLADELVNEAIALANANDRVQGAIPDHLLGSMDRILFRDRPRWTAGKAK